MASIYRVVTASSTEVIYSYILDLEVTMASPFAIKLEVIEEEEEVKSKPTLPR